MLFLHSVAAVQLCSGGQLRPKMGPLKTCQKFHFIFQIALDVGTQPEKLKSYHLLGHQKVWETASGAVWTDIIPGKHIRAHPTAYFLPHKSISCKVSEQLRQGPPPPYVISVQSSYLNPFVMWRTDSHRSRNWRFACSRFIRHTNLQNGLLRHQSCSRTSTTVSTRHR